MGDEKEDRKEYVKPEVTEELVLETRAGSPIGGGDGMPDPLDVP